MGSKVKVTEMFSGGGIPIDGSQVDGSPMVEDHLVARSSNDVNIHSVSSVTNVDQSLILTTKTGACSAW